MRKRKLLKAKGFVGLQDQRHPGGGKAKNNNKDCGIGRSLATMPAGTGNSRPVQPPGGSTTKVVKRAGLANGVELRGGTGQAKLARDQRTRMGKLRLAHGTRLDQEDELNSTALPAAPAVNIVSRGDQESDGKTWA